MSSRELFATPRWENRMFSLTTDGRKASISLTGYEQNVKVFREDSEGPVGLLEGDWSEVMPRVLLWLGKADYVVLP